MSKNYDLITVPISLKTTGKKRSKDKRKWPGLKKGSGQLPAGGYGMNGSGSEGSIGGEGGMGESQEAGLAFLRDLLTESDLKKIGDRNAGSNHPHSGDEQDSNIESSGDDPETNDYEPEEVDDGEVDENDPEVSIRVVKGAHLISKKEVETGSYDELWIYTIDPDITDPKKTPLKAILAGTDIQPNAMASEDGTQTYTIWTAGNAQYVHIKGLPN